MKRKSLIVGAVLALLLVATVTWVQVSAADDGLVRTEWPSAEDPGPPFYARIEPIPPFIYSDGEWAAIVFYRDPACIPVDFNLLAFFDAPAAFGCQLMVQGSSQWQGEAFKGAPKISTMKGAGAVSIWFVPADAIDQARQDNILTVNELAGLEGLLVGYANQFEETLHPHPLPPELGGGGHPNPKIVINAHGQLEDGRQFNLHITQVEEEIKAIQIQFR